MTTKKIYDFLKFMALMVFPAAGALYWALGEIWHFPATEQVIGTLAAIDTFLGAVIGKISKNFEANRPKPDMMGDLIMRQAPNGEILGMRLETHQENPIFQEGQIAGYRVRRVTEDEPSLDD